MRDRAGYGKVHPLKDPKLGCRVHNKKHHEQLMKAHGVHHITKEDIVTAGRRVQQESDRIDAWDAEERLALARNKDYRRALDKGVYTDGLDMPRAAREKVKRNLQREVESNG